MNQSVPSFPSIEDSSDLNENVVGIEIQSSDIVAKEKKFTSSVWSGYNRVYKNAEIEQSGKKVCVKHLHVTCKGCKNFKKVHTSKMGTTYLANHLKTCPGRNQVDSRQQIIDATITRPDGITVLTSYQFDDKKSQILLAKAIIVHEYPFNIVSHPRMQEYIHSLRPQHKIPCRTTITKLCSSVYNEEKKILYDMFASLSCRISLTMDKWTASTQNKSYLCITAHFVDDEWKLQKRIISFFNVHGSTGFDICNHLLNRLLEWNIDQKLFAVTVDNDRANDVALVHVKNRLGESIICKGVFFHVRCAAHIINLVVQSGLKVIASSIQKVRLSVKYVTCSPKIEASFEETAKQMNLDFKKGLSLDVCTRWNSTYLMLVDAYRYRLVFKRFGFKDPKYIHCPDDEEWEYINMLSECLKHFYDATELLSGSNYVTANLFFEEFCEIQLLLIEWTNSSDDVVVAMSQAMKGKFKTYWEMCNKILAVASFLDPRYKMRMIEVYFKDIYGHEYQKYVDAISDEIRNLYMAYASSSKFQKGDNQVLEQENDVEHCGGKRKSRFAEVIANEVEPVKTEIESYLEEKILRWKEVNGNKFDILGWWKQNVGRFPVLGAISRDVFGIPVSTVASESAFSTGGRVVDPFRSRLTPTMVETLICAQDWLRAREGGRSHSIMSFDDIDMDFMAPTDTTSSKTSTSCADLQTAEDINSDTMEDNL